MEFRLIAFTAMLVLTYWLRFGRWWPRWRSPTTARFNTVSALLLISATLTAIWLFRWLSGWAVFLDTPFFVVVPIDAMVAGIAVGFTLADQQIGAEQAALLNAKHVPETEPQRSTIGVIRSVPSALRDAVPSLTPAVVAMLAIVPPSSWLHALDRVQSVKAPGGIEVGLVGPAAGDKLAKDIQVAAPPRDSLTGSGTSDQHGFVNARIERMQTLTHQSEFRREARVIGSARPSYLQNPTAYLFTK